MVSSVLLEKLAASCRGGSGSSWTWPPRWSWETTHEMGRAALEHDLLDDPGKQSMRGVGQLLNMTSSMILGNNGWGGLGSSWTWPTRWSWETKHKVGRAALEHDLLDDPGKQRMRGVGQLLNMTYSIILGNNCWNFCCSFSTILRNKSEYKFRFKRSLISWTTDTKHRYQYTF